MDFVNTDMIFFIKSQRLNYKNTTIEMPASMEFGKTQRFNFEHHLIYANFLECAFRFTDFGNLHDNFDAGKCLVLPGACTHLFLCCFFNFIVY